MDRKTRETWKTPVIVDLDQETADVAQLGGVASDNVFNASFSTS